MYRTVLYLSRHKGYGRAMQGHYMAMVRPLLRTIRLRMVKATIKAMIKAMMKAMAMMTAIVRL